MPKRPLTDEDRARETARRERAWNKQAPRYDKQIGWCERKFLGTSHRPWACAQAEGKVLEVAVGTGLNIPHYPQGVELTGVDISPEMLAIARQRAAENGREVDLRQGDAHNLPFEDASFDTVLCTFSLCNIPDEGRAVAEMKRVLRPGGKLLLVDHVRSTKKVFFWLQRAVEPISVMIDGDHQTRRPLEHVRAEGFDVIDTQRFKAGVVERVVARRP